jgi:hypothetical protein
MAQDNPEWGYTWIQGAFGNLGHRVGRGAVANVLKHRGVEPSSERSKRTTWSTFKAHWKVLATSDFLTTEVWTTRDLVTHYLLFAISLAGRVVDPVGITTKPDDDFAPRRNGACVRNSITTMRLLPVTSYVGHTIAFRAG